MEWAARSGGRPGRGRRHFPARLFVFKGLQGDFPPPRRAARASLASRRRPVRGLSILSPRRQAFPRISKLFQGNSKEIPSFSTLFQGFPNFFLGRFEGNQGVIGQSTRNRVFSNFCVVSAATTGPAIGCRTRSRFNIARIRIIGKKLSAAISRRGLGASASSRAPTRKLTAATGTGASSAGSAMYGAPPAGPQ